MDETLVAMEQDGTTSRFREDALTDAFVHEMDRMRRHHEGKDPGLAHPFIVAPRTATNLEALIGEHGAIVGHLLGEDEIMRGVRERPGPPARWNDEEMVCT